MGAKKSEGMILSVQPSHRKSSSTTYTAAAAAADAAEVADAREKAATA